MATKSRNVRGNLTKVQNMSVDPENPVMDMDKMTDGERALFVAIAGACVEAVHKVQPVQQIKNMEMYFQQAARSGLLYAGMHVKQLRSMRGEFDKE